MKTLLLTIITFLFMSFKIGYIGQEAFFDVVPKNTDYELVFLKPIPDTLKVEYCHSTVGSAIGEANRVYNIVKK